MTQKTHTIKQARLSLDAHVDANVEKLKQYMHNHPRSYETSTVPR